MYCKNGKGGFLPELTVVAFVGCGESVNRGGSSLLCLWAKLWTAAWIESHGGAEHWSENERGQGISIVVYHSTY